MRQTTDIGEELQSGTDPLTPRCRRLLPCLYGALPPNSTLLETRINQRNYFAFILPILKTLSSAQTAFCWVIKTA